MFNGYVVTATMSYFTHMIMSLMQHVSLIHGNLPPPPQLSFTKAPIQIKTEICFKVKLQWKLYLISLSIHMEIKDYRTLILCGF
jgi:hypothetical protein